jgi:hypothetical protein
MKWYAFLAGWLAYAALVSISQDIVGKAEYLRSAEARWIPWYITVPLALFMLVISCMLMNKAEKES